MENTVESFCNELARCDLVPADEIRAARARWIKEAGPGAAHLDRFTAWLVAGGILTDYQVGVIQRDNGEQLRLGPYRVLERIGRGRMAGVYRAVHDLGTTVAIKILPPSKAAQPELLARFQREARLALAVRHPNVVRSFHTGEQRSLHFLVMEYLEGETLEDVLARLKRLSASDAMRIVHDALIGVQAIHEKGLVHRDLKPANIMLTGSKPESRRLTADVVIKILDLGMGRALFDEGGNQEQFDLTKAGDTLGSGDYLSPEQAKDAHNIDIRSDIYSMGCVLYHALAGQPPFADASPVRQMVRHASEEPRPIVEHTPDVPGGVQEVLNWMLAKDPARRYPTPKRAAQALEMFLAATSSVMPVVTPVYVAYAEWVDSLEGDAPLPVLSAVVAEPTAASTPRRQRETDDSDDPFITSLRQELTSASAQKGEAQGRKKMEDDDSARGRARSGTAGKKSVAPEKPRARKAPEPPPPPPVPRKKRRRDDEDETDDDFDAAEKKGNALLLVLSVIGGIVLLGCLGVAGWLVYRLLG
jgi:serine/threonine protein kinase